jgi:hypothetical protein
MMPFSTATSPPTLTWQYSLAIRVELRVTISTGAWGAAKRSSARSRSGLMATMGTPRRDALRSEVIILGLFVPGFCPITKIASVASKSSSRTVPLPMPMLSGRPTLVASWHMFEQSGKLFVPKRRTKS